MPNQVNPYANSGSGSPNTTSQATAEGDLRQNNPSLWVAKMQGEGRHSEIDAGDHARAAAQNFWHKIRGGSEE